MKKILLVIILLFAPMLAVAQNLPAGNIGVLPNGAGTNGWQTYSYTFTPATSGAWYVGFAFRQDPAYWAFSNVVVTAAGSSNNLITNGNMRYGGSVEINTANYRGYVNTPANWGVWYQNGTYPAAAGEWQPTGGPGSSGMWYDGAVGSYDGIYQGITVTSGITYTVSFQAYSTYGAENTSSIRLGTYAGQCSSGTTIFTCTPPSSSGFTPISTPRDGQGVGGAPPPSNSGPTTGSTSPEMNVAGGGSDHVFIWQGNSGNDWSNVQLIQQGWHWYCSTCTIRYGTVASVSNPSSDSIYIYLLDSNGNPVTPNSGYWYQFSSSPIAVDSSTSNQVTSNSSSSSSSFNNTGTLPNINVNGTNLNTYGYSVNGSTTTTNTTTTTTPVTTTTYSNGSTTTANGTTSSALVTTYSYNVSANIDSNVQINPYSNTNTNAVYIKQANGNANIVKAQQNGKTNLVAMYISGNSNNINSYQGYNVNTIGVATESSTGSNENVLTFSVTGNNNNVNGQQLGNNNTGTISITGNSNNSTVIQAGNNNQSLNVINGGWNSLTAIQTGSYNLSSINLNGNSNNASVTQTGNNNSSALNLTNAGGANNVTVNQNGNNYSYSLMQTCYVSSGCNTTISQHQ